MQLSQFRYSSTFESSLASDQRRYSIHFWPVVLNLLFFMLSLQLKYSVHSTHYLEMIFINREQIASLESKFHFQTEDWNLSTVDSFEVRNVECIVSYVSQKVTHEIRNRWWLLASVGLRLWGIFLNFQEHFLCIYSTLVFKKYSSQF